MIKVQKLRWVGTVLVASTALAMLPTTGRPLSRSIEDDLDAALAQLRDAAVRFDSEGLLLVRERLRPFVDAGGEESVRALYGLAFADFVSLLSPTLGAVGHPLEETRERVARAEANLETALTHARSGASSVARPLALRALLLRLLANARQRAGVTDGLEEDILEASRLMESAVEADPDDLEVAAANVLLLLMTPDPETQVRAQQMLQDLSARLRELPAKERELATSWWSLTIRAVRVRQSLSARAYVDALTLARETLALEPDYAALREMLPGLEGMAAVADATYTPTPSARLADLAWKELARDPGVDGNVPELPDARTLSYAENGNMIWFRFALEGPAPAQSVGMNLVVDIDGDPTNGRNWWGENSSFRWDRLVTVWLEADTDGTYRGIVGIADPNGPGLMDPGNVHRGDLAFALLPEAMALGIPRRLFAETDRISLVGAVGSDRAWNDDIPGTGFVTVQLSSGR